jgi:hypothetical protein
MSSTELVSGNSLQSASVNSFYISQRLRRVNRPISSDLEDNRVLYRVERLDAVSHGHLILTISP